MSEGGNRPCDDGADSPEPGETEAGGQPRLRWAAKTHVGRFRKVNQDAYLMFACGQKELALFPNSGDYGLTSSDVVLAVSDGMGGEKLGHRASELALSKLSDIIPRHLQRADEGATLNHCDVLGEAVYAAHAAVRREASHYDECEGMGATLTACWFTRTSVHLAHVGDSRVYLFANSRLKQLSQDHSLVGEMQRRGKLTEMQARRHPKRHQLSQAVGARAGVIAPQFLSASHAPGDLYLLCSDGLTDGLWDKRIARGLQNYREKTSEGGLEGVRDALLELALTDSGRDNITLILAEILG